MASAGSPMRASDLTLATVGGLLLASGMRRAQSTHVDATRAEIMRHLHRARRRASNTGSFVGVVIGALVLGYVARRIVHDLVAGEDAEAPEPAPGMERMETDADVEDRHSLLRAHGDER